MLRYIGRRLLGFIPIWFVLSVLSFSLLHLAGGSPAAVMLGAQATPESLKQLTHQLGLDQPLLFQYGRWVAGILHGDFGESIFLNAPVLSVLVGHFGVTLSITLVGFLVAAILGLAAGTVAAVGKGGPADLFVILGSSLGSAVPEFLLGLVLLLLFAYWLPIFPAQGYVTLTSAPGNWLAHILLPSLAIGLIQAGPLARFVRNALRRSLASDYVRTARAKGVGWGALVFRHALASALLPVLTGVGLIFTALLGGAFASEVVFNLPGLGRLMLNSALGRDFPTLQGGVLFIGTLIMLVNLVVDLSYALVDPRVSYD